MYCVLTAPVRVGDTSGKIHDLQLHFYAAHTIFQAEPKARGWRKEKVVRYSTSAVSDCFPWCNLPSISINHMTMMGVSQTYVYKT